MKNNIIILPICISIIANFQDAFAANPPTENRDPQILRIDGPTDLGVTDDNRAYNGTYVAPADYGNPPYKYTWSVVDGNLREEAYGSTARFFSHKIGSVMTITASIKDQDGKTHSLSKSVNIHKEYEVFPSPSPTLEKQTQHRAYVLSVENSTNIQQAVTKTEEVTWRVEIGISPLYKKGLQLELGGKILVSRETKDTLTVPVVAPPKTRIDVYVVPTVFLETGTWKEWQIGMTDSGNYEKRRDESVTYEFIETAL